MRLGTITSVEQLSLLKTAYHATDFSGGNTNYYYYLCKLKEKIIFLSTHLPIAQGIGQEQGIHS